MSMSEFRDPESLGPERRAEVSLTYLSLNFPLCLRVVYPRSAGKIMLTNWSVQKGSMMK